MEIKKNIYAYIAGVIDGDGYVSIIPQVSKSSPVLYKGYASVDGVNSTLPNLLKDMFGGSVTLIQSRVGKDGSKRKAYYSWRLVGNKKCLFFVDSILPYLHGKKKEALVLKELLDHGENHVSGKWFTDEDRIYRASLFAKIKSVRHQSRLMSDFDKSSYVRPVDSSLSEDFWSYVAGIMDTDGSFSIGKRLLKSVKNGSEYNTWTYRPYILVSLTNPRSIEYMVANFNYGSIMQIKAPNAKQGFCYRLDISNVEEVKDLLPQLIPFMVVKKDAALKLLEFCREYKTMNGRYRKDLLVEENKKRSAYYDELVAINKNGFVEPSNV